MFATAFFTWLLLFFGFGGPPPCDDDLTLVSAETCETAEDGASSMFDWLGVTNDISNGI